MIRAIDRLERQTNRELARRPQDQAAIIAREKKRVAGMMKRWGWSPASRRWVFGKEPRRPPKD
jgi:hypothetical protein